MRDPADSIDMSPLEQLLRLRQEQARIDEFRARAERLRNGVDEAVYLRVAQDYETRRATIAHEAEPLEAAARTQFRALQALYDDARARHEEARLIKQELEFRHAVGELDETRLAEKCAEPERRLEECRTELAALDARRVRFVEALGSIAELESQPAAEEQIAFVPDPHDSTTTSEAAQEPVHAQWAVLVGPQEGEASETHHLGLSTYIGRSDDNQIRVLNPSVSRQHALIAAGASGFVIQDLHSQNGTYVNGERVTRHPLADGDLIMLGEVEFLFRVVTPGSSPNEPWADEPTAAIDIELER